MNLRSGVLLLLLCGCATAPPPPPPPPPPEPTIVPFAAPVVWTSEAGVGIATEPEGEVTITRALTPLTTIGVDSIGLLVQCEICEGRPVGYVDTEAVVHEVLPPEIAAWGSLGEFALAVHDAAGRRDLEALRPVMAVDFTFSLVGTQNPDAAFAVWRAEEFETLDRVPSLLSDGLDTIEGTIWSAPPSFVTDLAYRGLRLGFRRSPDGRWEWLYLIRGVTG